MKIVLLSIAALAALAVACGDGDEPSATQPPAPGNIVAFSMQSDAFADGATIPERYTCDDADLSPSLFWEEPPEGTEAFALTVTDPDAPGDQFIHWVYYNIPGDARSLPEAVEVAKEPSNGGRQANNDFGDPGYGGPCPPQGPAHRYVFTLTALSRELTLGPNPSYEDVRDAAADSAVGQATFSGTYGR